MIKLRDDVAHTLINDGMTAVLDVEALQARLKRSWRAAGYPDDSLAEDVALSVELALSEFGVESALTPAEVDVFVVKVLRAAGLVEVAEHFGLDSSPSVSAVAVDSREVSAIVERFMRLDGVRAENLTKDVLNAAAAIGLSTASPELILELARHFHAKSAEMPPPSSVPFRHLGGDSKVWIIQRGETSAMFAAATRRLISEGVLAVGGVSALFPSIKLQFDPARFADSLDLTPPTTELALLPRMSPVADALNDVVTSIDEAVGESVGSDLDGLPVHLKILNPDVFTNVWLGAGWPESRSCLVDFLETFSEALVRKVRIHA